MEGGRGSGGETGQWRGTGQWGDRVLSMKKELNPVELDFLLRFPFKAGVVSPVDFLQHQGWGGIKRLHTMCASFPLWSLSGWCYRCSRGQNTRLCDPKNSVKQGGLTDGDRDQDGLAANSQIALHSYGECDMC
ncbi:hypothetical protein P7K49_011925 [Saguinus oedipus]|uniref:Uncharacterized protein n=1 Tax=Saguinus oedipus TaxID=9490 RepID=A0ABQ9VUF7_SAGOE|nr:hypothetical protein P7K49_011925 [Saguinus oedipus]